MKRDGYTEQGNLFDFLARQRELTQRSWPLDRLKEAIHWEDFRPTLEVTLAYADGKKGGRPPMDPVLMFQICVLQLYYDLSDEETEWQIRDRASFQRFLDLRMSDKVPDANTLWTFKERLGADGIEALFSRFEAQLQARGLAAKAGKMIDAAIIEVPRQRNGREENAEIKAGQRPESFDENTQRGCQKDTDARWTKKNGHNYYGYKNHIKVDLTTKLVEAYTVSPANLHDSQAVEELTCEGDGRLYADSAYASQKIEADLQRKGISSYIHEKGSASHPLSAEQKQLNRLKSGLRARVEHVFGWQRPHGGRLLRTIGIERARRGIGLQNLVYNLCRWEYLIRPKPGRACAHV